MSTDHHARGGAAVGHLNTVERWEADLVVNLRLWCEGPQGRHQIRDDYDAAFPGEGASGEFEAFETLLHQIIAGARRPLVRHSVGCGCIGCDEAVFLNLVRTAAEGHAREAALIATLLLSAHQAEEVAQLARRVGLSAQRMHNNIPEHITPARPPNATLH
ncbi:MAG: hypothetical protein AAF943_01770 [Pseudomonadota bacterium]